MGIETFPGVAEITAAEYLFELSFAGDPKKEEYQNLLHSFRSCNIVDTQLAYDWAVKRMLSTLIDHAVARQMIVWAFFRMNSAYKERFPYFQVIDHRKLVYGLDHTF